MNIIWTDEAKVSYKNTISSILDFWNVEIALRVENDVNVLLGNLANNKNICPVSKSDKNVRRCVISKQTSLLYEVKGDDIYLMSFIDNRSNHKHF